MRTKEIVGAILALTLFLGIVPVALAADPFTVGGHVYLGTAPVPGADVNVTDLHTGESLTTTTDSNGIYRVFLGSLPGGHSAGDIIQVTATYNGMTGTNNASRSENLSDSPQIIDVTIAQAVATLGSITISRDSPDPPNIDGSLNFTAVCKDTTSGVMTCPTLTWTSSNSAVGTITDSVFSALIAGTTTITASAGVTSNAVTVAVNAESSSNQTVTGGNGSATSGDSHADVILNDTIVSGTVKVAEIGDPINDTLSSAGGNDTGLGLGPNANHLIKGAVVTVSQSVRDALRTDVNDTSWVYIRLNYNQSVVDSLGINEGSIDIWKYNTSTNSWEKVKDQPYCIDSDRDTTDNYVWVKVTELSTFALVGTKSVPSRRGGGGGGGDHYPPGWYGTPTATPGVTPGATPGATPGVTPSKEAVTKPTTKPAVTEKATPEGAEGVPTKKPGTPGFTSVFAIAGLLAIAYAMMRRRG